jgi:phospholipid/cholesterol/gamma-HCH transport system substrate-binding protein
MRNTLETRLGIFFAMALLAAIMLVEVVGGLDVFRKGKQIHALFNSVQELKAGDPVKMAGVEVGKVEKITLADEKVDVTMKVARDAAVRTDSKATIKFTGLLGQNYVSITFGSPKSPIATSGFEITTEEQPDFAALMAKLDTVASAAASLTNLSSLSFSELLGPLTDFVKQSSPQFKNILTNVQNVSSNIALGKGTLGILINDNALYSSALSTVTNYNDTATQIKDLVAQAKTTIHQINEGQGTLGKLATDETLYRQTTAAVTNFKEILEKINQGKGSIGPLVNDPSFYRNVRLTLQKVEKATESIEDEGPLSVLGTVAGKLF